LEAVRQALKELVGAYAIAIIEKGDKTRIIAARKSSPLVVGIGQDEFFLASDATPIVEYTDKVVYLNDGETAYTLAAIELAKNSGAFIFGICNMVGSSIARTTDSGAYIHVGPEIGVASTKAFTGQVTVLMMLALTLGHQKGTLSHEFYLDKIKHLCQLSEQISEILELDSQIADLAKIFTIVRYNI
jgi:glucosamine 6-phosphate synthetase-like amidotransferase/phosphosugar isomerase protein